MGVQSTAGGDQGPASLFSGEASDPKSVVNRDLVGAVLEDDEIVVYGLPASGKLVWKKRIETERITGDELGLVVTDRRLMFVARQQEGRQMIVHSYSEIDTVAVTETLFKTRLTITVQDGDEYNLKPTAKAPLRRVCGYIEIASECVDQVESALDRARIACEELTGHLRAGRTEQATAAREEMRAAVGSAERELEEAGVDPGCSDEIETVRRECARQVVEARRYRVGTRSEEAIHKADVAAYTQAYRMYLDAREHLEVALALSLRYGFDEVEAIQDAIETVDSRIECLKSWPLALAKQTRERAMRTDTLDTAVEAWQQTLEHYRDLLLAGWGTDLDFAGSRSNIRFQLACALNNLVESQRALARQRTTEGDHLRKAGETEEARACYREALDQLDDALDVAREFRAGDETDIRAQRETIETRFDSDLAL
jgi:tetratricopeptide (TPR) repeat protein